MLDTLEHQPASSSTIETTTPEPTKPCSKCGKSKPLSSFSKGRGQCRDCRNASNRVRTKTPKYKAWRATYESREGVRERLKAYELKPDVKSRRAAYRCELESRARKLINESNHRAKRKELEFDLTLDWLLPRLRNGYCGLTQIAYDFSPPQKGLYYNPYAPSIDRIDSFKGYTEDNCRLILAQLNIAFGQSGAEVCKEIMIAWLRADGHIVI